MRLLSIEINIDLANRLRTEHPNNNKKTETIFIFMVASQMASQRVNAQNKITIDGNVTTSA